MRVSQIGSAAVGLLLPVLGALCACGTSAKNWGDAGNSVTTGSSSSSSGGPGVGDATPGGDDGSFCLTCTLQADATVGDAGSDAPTTVTATPGQPAVGTLPASDCPGCTFPPANAPSCPSTAPAIKLVYPPDTVLVPPNLNVISVHWTPFGPPFSRFEVDFSQSLQAPVTDWHIITSCKNQTIDAQSGAPSGGCEVVLDPVSWSRLVGANRGGSNPIAITVRGTTDGSCASTSANSIHLSIAEEDLLGTYYYWKSTVSPNGVGGQIWAKIFGDLTTPEVDVSSKAIANASCNGCHSLSRDGSRMVIYSDDDDSDDEYSDVAGSYLDMTPLFANPATEFPGGVTGVRMGGQPPGFSTIDPLATYYVTSNGYPYTLPGAPTSGTSTGYPTAVPTNGWSLWNGTNGAFIGGVTIGAPMTRPTMPDWSIDGTTVVYVQPTGDLYKAAGATGNWRHDDAHIYGGSLYTVPYMGAGVFGTPTAFLQSGGENNYYPSYSPDNPMSYVIFNRVDNMNAGAACANGLCLDDSFSNPSARLMLIQNVAGATPIDLQKANGSTLAAKTSLSNSYPRWAPFVQSYHGQKLLWFTFSSTRDYGVRVLNHKTGMYQCYPADAAETPGATHKLPFAALCQEPQLWMAPLTYTEAQGSTADPSGVAFWIPYQDILTHNHTAQWTWKPNPIQPPPDAGIPPCSCSNLYGPCGASNGGCGCCTGMNLICSGTGQCIQPVN
jgi:hypothetical protein